MLDAFSVLSPPALPAYLPAKLLPRRKPLLACWPASDRARLAAGPADRNAFLACLAALDHAPVENSTRGDSTSDSRDTIPRLPIHRAVDILVRPRRLGMNTLLDAHRAAMGAAAHGGQLRRGSCAVRCRQTQAILYVPPPARHLPSLLDDLLAFAGSNVSPDPLFGAFVCLMQLILIHPFVDGNGRTARALFAALCLRRGFTHPVAPLALARLYAAAATRLYAGSAAIRAAGDWTVYFGYCDQSLRQAAATAG